MAVVVDVVNTTRTSMEGVAVGEVVEVVVVVEVVEGGVEVEGEGVIIMREVSLNIDYTSTHTHETDRPIFSHHQPPHHPHTPPHTHRIFLLLLFFPPHRRRPPRPPPAHRRGRLRGL